VGHPLAAKAPLALQDLLTENWIGLPRESALQQLLQQQAMKLNGHLLRTQVQLPHFEGLCQLVGQRVGITVLPLAAVQRHAASTGVVVAALTDSWAQRQLWLCTNPTPPSTPVQQLQKYLLQSSALSS
jgi:DNA-binding transcriptional LysR family regulator